MVWVRSETIVDLDRRRDRGFELRQQRLDAIDRVDDVGAGHALNGQDDGALLVVPAGQQVVLRPFDRLADIADAHRRAVAVGDDQLRRRPRASAAGRWC